jgi:hypothetical protein
VQFQGLNDDRGYQYLAGIHGLPLLITARITLTSYRFLEQGEANTAIVRGAGHRCAGCSKEDVACD